MDMESVFEYTKEDRENLELFYNEVLQTALAKAVDDGFDFAYSLSVFHNLVKVYVDHTITHVDALMTDRQTYLKNLEKDLREIEAELPDSVEE